MTAPLSTPIFVMDMRSPNGSRSLEPEFPLQTFGLRRSFGWRVVIEQLDLKVPAGQVYGFLGRNGAGKTTAIRMLLGILRPDAGTLCWNGQEVAQTTAALKAKVGYVSQQQHFYEWMRVERLGRFVRGFYPTWDHSEFHRLLTALHIEPRQRVGELSGGTKMKLAMTLALAHRPRILVLDEPTAGVDPIARREILDLLRAQVDDEGRTVFFSTHHISEVEEIGDHIGVLHGGRLHYQGPVDGFAEPGKLEEAFVAIAREDR